MNKLLKVFQLKVSLRGSSPLIWRRVQVFEDIPLVYLHRVVQIVMGWDDSHLHEFHIAGEEYGVPNREFDFDGSVLDERKVSLGELVSRVRTKFQYIYDFGDNWTHDVVLERILPADPEVKCPVCLAGERNGPPEDVGGIWGYADFLEALADPEHERHEEQLKWSGPFEPDKFSLEEVNVKLRRTFRVRKTAAKR